MKTQTIYVDACTSTGIAIGRRNTYATEQIVFGLAQLVQQYGAGSAVLMVLRPTDTTPYPAVTSQSGTELTWTVSATDTSITGTGECELYWYVDGGLAKSVIFPLTIQRDIVTEPIDEPPEPYQTWVDDLTDLGAETLQNAQAAAQSATDAETAQGLAEDAKTAAETAQGKAETAQGKAETAQEKAETAQTAAEAAADRAEDALEEFTTPTASANTLEPDEEATASYANGHFTFGIPKGVPGDPGDPGVTPDFSIGTVQTLQPTEPATASITGTAEHPVLNLGIPQGVQGDPATNLVQSVNGKTGAVVLGAGDIGYDGETTYPDASVGKELGAINSALSSLQSVTEIIDTASGAIASFPDGSGLPMRSLVAQINPVQDLHGYDYPWPAGCGTNKYNKDTSVRGAIIETGEVSTNDAWITSDFIPISGNAITLSWESSTSYFQARAFFFDANKAPMQDGFIPYTQSDTYSHTWEIPSGSAYVRFSFSIVVGGISRPRENIRVSLGSVDHGYSPYSNECPISGWTGLSGERTGANVFDQSNVLDFYVGGVGGTTVGIGGTLIAMPVKKGVTYTINGTIGNRSGLYYTYLSPSEISYGVVLEPNPGYQFLAAFPFTFTAHDTCTLCFYVNTDWDQTIADSIYAVVGSSVETYTPYTGEPISVSFPSTVYGGTDEVIGGNGTSTFVAVDLGDLSYSRSPSGLFVATVHDAYTELAQGNAGDAFSDTYIFMASGPITGSNPDYYYHFAINNGNVLYISDPRYTDTSEFKAAMAGSKIIYRRNEPQAFTHEGQQISTLYGQNNVWVDTGDISVTYQASIKGYIDKVLGS